MKKLDRLILKSFLGPLVLTFAIAVFVLLMQFVWKYIDDLVGKGLEFIVIARLLFYASATFVPMALPISVLFASIMTMGNFGERYELIAMKSSGVSLSRVMMPMAFVVLLLSGVAFVFANNVLPVAMLKYRTILYDVTRKKPAINIRPSEYFSDIDGYVIRANTKSSDGSTLGDITIYDHTHGSLTNNTITARSGRLQSSADERYLFFTLRDGTLYNEEQEGNHRLTRPFTRVDYRQQVITFDISSFAFGESDQESFAGSYQMMNVAQLRTTIGELQGTIGHRRDDFALSISERYVPRPALAPAPADTLPAPAALPGLPPSGPRALASRSGPSHLPAPPPSQQRALSAARRLAQRQRDQVAAQQAIIDANYQYLNRHHIELHRKFTLSIACLLLFLVGAPFGSIVRKGGLGLPLVASVAIFVLYYVVGMICEKAVRESALPPIGMWVSSFVLLPIGIILTYIATTDNQLKLFSK